MGRTELFERFPGLRTRLPFRAIVTDPTPVYRTGIPDGSGRTFWVKDDGLSALPYGGNKPRKLEFLLGDALARSAGSVITTGGIGSNHCLATAVYASLNTLACHLLLFPQPVTIKVRRQLRLFHHWGARLHHETDFSRAADRLEELARRTENSYVIPAGGSNGLGALGFVNAGLEFARQVRNGLCPEPEQIFIPAGTCGSAAGLLLGLKIAGLKSHVMAVQVVESPVAGRGAIHTLYREAASILSCESGEKIPDLDDTDFTVVETCLGRGYGVALPEPSPLGSVLREHLNIRTEPVYTDKALTALWQFLTRGHQGPILFWHTFSGRSMNHIVLSEGNEGIPREFWEYLVVRESDHA